MRRAKPKFKPKQKYLNKISAKLITINQRNFAIEWSVDWCLCLVLGAQLGIASVAMTAARRLRPLQAHGIITKRYFNCNSFVAVVECMAQTPSEFIVVAHNTHTLTVTIRRQDVPRIRTSPRRTEEIDRCNNRPAK